MQSSRRGNTEPDARSLGLCLVFVEEVVIVPLESLHRYSLWAQRMPPVLGMQGSDGRRRRFHLTDEAMVGFCSSERLSSLIAIAAPFEVARSRYSNGQRSQRHRCATRCSLHGDLDGNGIASAPSTATAAPSTATRAKAS
jgi:hypothetical protein